MRRAKKTLKACSPVGEGLRPNFICDRSEAVPKLVEVGMIDIYAEIQSLRDSCEINRVVERYINGDLSALQRAQGLFGDFSDIPNDSTTAHALRLEVLRYYESLPFDLRQELGGFDNFLAALQESAKASSAVPTPLEGVKTPSEPISVVKEDFTHEPA